MYAVYKMRVNELDGSFLENLKNLFKDREIEIAVSEVGASAEDETAYLLDSPANRRRLLRAIENIAQGRNLVAVDLDELQ
jgi:antitoxin YefM